MTAKRKNKGINLIILRVLLYEGSYKHFTGQSAMGCFENSPYSGYLWRTYWQRIWSSTAMYFFICNIFNNFYVVACMFYSCHLQCKLLTGRSFTSTRRQKSRKKIANISMLLRGQGHTSNFELWYRFLTYLCFGKINPYEKRDLTRRKLMHSVQLNWLTYTRRRNHSFKPPGWGKRFYMLGYFCHHLPFFLSQRLLSSFVNRLFTVNSFESDFPLVLDADGVKGKNVSMPDGIRYPWRT